jgi:hypothetical protein
MTITDPWATTTPEPEAAPEPTFKEVHPIADFGTSDARPAVSAVPEGKLTLTFKGTGTFADRWLVAHVANPSEGLTLLKDPEFKELLDLSKKIAVYDGSGAAVPAPQGGSTGGRQSAPQGATEAPAWAPAKPFEDFVYKSGVSKKNGKVWHAWMPPTQEDSRDPKFFYPPN